MEDLLADTAKILVYDDEPTDADARPKTVATNHHKVHEDQEENDGPKVVAKGNNAPSHKLHEATCVKNGVDPTLWAGWFAQVRYLKNSGWDFSWSGLKTLRMHPMSKVVSTLDLDSMLASVLSHNITDMPFAGGVVAKISNHQPPVKWFEASPQGSPKLIVLIPFNVRSKITVELQNESSTTKHPMEHGDFLYFPPSYTVLLPGLNSTPLLYCMLWYGPKPKSSHEPVLSVCFLAWGGLGPQARGELIEVRNFSQFSAIFPQFFSFPDFLTASPRWCRTMRLHVVLDASKR